MGCEEEPAFRVEAITTPTITDYRTYLQQTLRLKPNSVNRSLISLKRYFVWVLSTGHIKHDPAKVVKLAYDPSLRGPSQDSTPLFLSEKKHARLTEWGLGYLINKYAKRANVRDVSPHDLRHRFGYRMAATVPLHRLAQLMACYPTPVKGRGRRCGA